MTDNAVLNHVSNLVMPTHYVELDSDEMSYVDGGWIVTVNLHLYISMGGLISGLASGFITGAITAACVSMFASVGHVVGAVLGAVAGLIISSVINSAINAGGGTSSITLLRKSFKMWIPFARGTYNISRDIGSDIGGMLGGGIGGGISGAAAAGIMSPART
ncbi:MAG: Blp family class II bacteriocin [Roseburia sp.]|nr:Blp family class II bacteriocin [Roseburia sp.]